MKPADRLSDLRALAEQRRELARANRTEALRWLGEAAENQRLAEVAEREANDLERELGLVVAGTIQ